MHVDPPVDPSSDWSTCAGQLSYLVKDLESCESLLQEVRNEDCPDIERFLSNVEDLTKHICLTSKEISKNAKRVLDSMKQNKLDVDPSVCEASCLPSPDPGQRGEIKTDEERKYLIALGPYQPNLSKFRESKDISKQKQCRFSATWYKLYPHLEYSVVEDRAYCFVCSLFPTGPGRELADPAWTKGMNQWHKMRSRGTAKRGKLEEHFSCKSHKAALGDFLHFKQQAAHLDIIMDRERRNKEIQEQEDLQNNKDAVAIPMDVPRTLARQGLAFRGHSSGDGGEVDGNFYQIVQLMGRHSHIMRWLGERRLRPYHVTCMSPRTQNEFISILASDVRTKIRDSVNEAGIYSVMADTTPDVSTTDRLAVAVRFVDETGTAKERLVEIRKTEDKTGDGQATDIIETLIDYDLDPKQLAFQSYDFASNISGHTNGAQALVSKKLERKVPYIPCQAHRCNTVVEHACNCSHLVTEMFNVMEDFYDFFSSSTKQHEVLSKYMEDVANALKLRNLSKTRWTARAESIQAVWISYEAIVEALEEILTKPVDAKTRAHASGLLKKIKQLDFIASIMFMKNIMLKTSKLAEALQAEELNILDALKNTRSTISVLKRFKASESEMNDQIKASCKFAEKIGIDPEEDFKKHHRKRRKPARADDNPNTQVDLTMPQHFRKEFKSVLDTFINMFEDKIAPTLDTVLPMVRVLQPPFKDTIPNDDDVVALCNMFVTEKDPGAVSVELELFRDRTSDETITSN